MACGDADAAPTAARPPQDQEDARRERRGRAWFDAATLGSAAALVACCVVPLFLFGSAAALGGSLFLGAPAWLVTALAAVVFTLVAFYLGRRLDLGA